MPKRNLTQQFVQSSNLCPADKSKVDYFDTKIPGLVFKALKSGRRTYYLRYQDVRGKTQEKKLGAADRLSLADARQLATERLTTLAMGIDPFEQKKTLKEVPTFAQFVEQSYLPHIKAYKRSWRTDVCLLNKHILPAIGSLHLDEITRRHLVDLFNVNRQTHKPSSTNRLIVLCRYIFNCAMRWETAGATRNPTAGIDLFVENNKRERYLTSEEAARLFETITRSRNPQLKWIVAMLLLTGARKGEVLTARWKDLDLERRIWTVEFNKTGTTRYIPISDGLLEMLSAVEQLRISGCEWLFPNPKTLKPYNNIFNSWDVARKRAGMPELRLHDLRHSFASFLINSGRSLYEVQNILGHTQVKTTQRYAHLTQDSLIAAADTATRSLPSLSTMMPNRASQVALLEAR